MRRSEVLVRAWRAAFLAAALTAAPLPRSGQAADAELVLAKIIAAFELRPLPTKPFAQTPKFFLGQALFFDPILSGNRDVSCATCHLLRRGTSDGLPLSIGTGGTGLGEARTPKDGGLRHPRNALDLWNRDNNAVLNLFWDGRVEVLDPEQRIFRSPLGASLPAGLENALAVQALFPLARPDEMLGAAGDRADPRLPVPHGGRPNELAEAAERAPETMRIQAVHNAVMDRLLGRRSGRPEPWQTDYRELFREAYPTLELHQISIVHLGNAIAHFEEIAFATRDAPWDRYLVGDRDALSAEAKQGAIVFYGKGRCVVCHTGPLFSDFDFHGLGVNQPSEARLKGVVDLGRYEVTGDPADKYQFRTPPLRNVTLTAPYFHDGLVPTLRDAINHHRNPLEGADRYDETGAHQMTLEKIDAVSPVLQGGIPTTDDDVSAIIAFLGALESYPRDIESSVLSQRVPSGLDVHTAENVQ